MEIFGLNQNQAIVALKRTRFILDDAITHLCEESFLSSIFEEAAKMAPLPADSPKTPSEAIAASDVISNNPDHLNILFDLLNLPSIDQQKVMTSQQIIFFCDRIN